MDEQAAEGPQGSGAVEARNKTDQYDRRGKIGKGAFGDVFLCYPRAPALAKTPCVLKSVRLARQNEWQRQATKNEIKLMAALKHPFVVPFVDSWLDNTHTVNVVLGYCEQGDLGAVLTKRQSKLFEESTLKRWLAQLLLALHYLGEQGVLHRDIKTTNIFLHAEGHVQLGDFGLADAKDVHDTAAVHDQSLVGTPHFMSPELLSQKGYSYPTDVWSLGVCLYELSAQKPPFTAFNLNGLVEKIKKKGPAPLPPVFTPEWSTLIIKHMLHKDPAKRSTPLELLAMPCLRQTVAEECRNARLLMPTVLLPTLPDPAPEPEPAAAAAPVAAGPAAAAAAVPRLRLSGAGTTAGPAAPVTPPHAKVVVAVKGPEEDVHTFRVAAKVGGAPGSPAPKAVVAGAGGAGRAASAQAAAKPAPQATQPHLIKLLKAVPQATAAGAAKPPAATAGTATAAAAQQSRPTAAAATAGASAATAADRPQARVSATGAAAAAASATGSATARLPHAGTAPTVTPRPLTARPALATAAATTAADSTAMPRPVRAIGRLAASGRPPARVPTTAARTTSAAQASQPPAPQQTAPQQQGDAVAVFAVGPAEDKSSSEPSPSSMMPDAQQPQQLQGRNQPAAAAAAAAANQRHPATAARAVPPLRSGPAQAASAAAGISAQPPLSHRNSRAVTPQQPDVASADVNDVVLDMIAVGAATAVTSAVPPVQRGRTLEASSSAIGAGSRQHGERSSSEGERAPLPRAHAARRSTSPRSGSSAGSSAPPTRRRWTAAGSAGGAPPALKNAAPRRFTAPNQLDAGAPGRASAPRPPRDAVAGGGDKERAVGRGGVAEPAVSGAGRPAALRRKSMEPVAGNAAAQPPWRVTGAAAPVIAPAAVVKPQAAADAQQQPQVGAAQVVEAEGGMLGSTLRRLRQALSSRTSKARQEALAENLRNAKQPVPAPATTTAAVAPALPAGPPALNRRSSQPTAASAPLVSAAAVPHQAKPVADTTPMSAARAAAARQPAHPGSEGGCGSGLRPPGASRLTLPGYAAAAAWSAGGAVNVAREEMAALPADPANPGLVMLTPPRRTRGPTQDSMLSAAASLPRISELDPAPASAPLPALGPHGTFADLTPPRSAIVFHPDSEGGASSTPTMLDFAAVGPGASQGGGTDGGGVPLVYEPYMFANAMYRARRTADTDLSSRTQSMAGGVSPLGVMMGINTPRDGDTPRDEDTPREGDTPREVDGGSPLHALPPMEAAGWVDLSGEASVGAHWRSAEESGTPAAPSTSVRRVMQSSFSIGGSIQQWADAAGQHPSAAPSEGPSTPRLCKSAPGSSDPDAPAVPLAITTTITTDGTAPGAATTTHAGAAAPSLQQLNHETMRTTTSLPVLPTHANAAAVAGGGRVGSAGSNGGGALVPFIQHLMPGSSFGGSSHKSSLQLSHDPSGSEQGVVEQGASRGGFATGPAAAGDHQHGSWTFSREGSGGDRTSMDLSGGAVAGARLSTAGVGGGAAGQRAWERQVEELRGVLATAHGLFQAGNMAQLGELLARTY